MRRVSRTTASRYGRALSSSMVGLSVPTVRSSFRSLVCTSRRWVNAKSAQVVAELFKLETCFQKLSLLRPCGFVSSNQKCGDLYHETKHSIIEKTPAVYTYEQEHPRLSYVDLVANPLTYWL